MRHKRNSKKLKKQTNITHDDIKLWLALAVFSNFAAEVLGLQLEPTPPESLPEECPIGPSGVDPTKVSKVQISVDYPNIFARNVTDIKKWCTWKSVGKNQGRICCWDDVWRFMKYEVSNARLLEMYHNLLVRNNFNITVPNVEFVINEGNLALASERILNLKTGKTLRFLKVAKSRKEIIKIIGERGFAQLHVVSSIISDTIAPENWGYVNKRLVLIDIDGGKNPDGSSMQPKTLTGYLNLGRSIFLHDPSRLPFSVNNLIEMKEIYASMLTKPVPKLHPFVDMSDQLYHDIFTNYVEVFDTAIKKILTETPDIKLDQPQFSNNDIVSWTISDSIELINATEYNTTLENTNPTQNTPPVQLNTASIMAGLGTVIASAAVNTTSQNLANISASTITLVANQTMIKNATQAMITQVVPTMINATTEVAKAAMELVEIEASPQSNKLFYQPNRVSNEMLYTVIKRSENSDNMNLMLQTLALLLTAGAFLLIACKPKSVFSFFNCCKSKRKASRLETVVINGLKLN